MAEFPGGFEPEQGGLSAFFGQLVDQGYSQNQAIAAFREAGGRGANDLLRQEFNIARDFAEARPVGWGQPVDQPFGRDQFVEWEAGSPGRAMYPVDIHVRTPDGSVEIVPSMVFGDEGMTPEDIFGQAIDTYGTGMADLTVDTPEVEGDIVSVSMRGAPFLTVRRAA